MFPEFGEEFVLDIESVCTSIMPHLLGAILVVSVPDVITEVWKLFTIGFTQLTNTTEKVIKNTYVC